MRRKEIDGKERRKKSNEEKKLSNQDATKKRREEKSSCATERFSRTRNEMKKNINWLQWDEMEWNEL